MGKEIVTQKSVRADRLLSAAGLGSRKEVQALFRSGRVQFQGKTVKKGNAQIPTEEADLLQVNGGPILLPHPAILMMNKAPDRLTAMEDARYPVVAMDLDEEDLLMGVLPVGRLDRDTTGLLFFTNDGQLNHRLTSPVYEIPRVYRLSYSGPRLGEREVEILLRGQTLDDGSLCRPARLEPLENHEARLTLTEGKFHEVKRLISSLDREVTALHRESYAGIALDPELAPGESRPLFEEEKLHLYESVELSPLKDSVLML